MKRIVTSLVLVLALFCSVVPIKATTYYVDFATGADTNNGTSKGSPWKFAPGMSSCANICASVTLVASDNVIFKGGVTWSSGWYPWTLAFSGSAGNPISYTTDHTWFTGGSYSQPIIDGNQNNAQSVLSNSGVHHITVNDLKIQNVGIAHNATSASVKAIQFQESHDVSVTNCTFATETWITMYFSFLSAGSYSNFTWTGNDFSHTSGAMWLASAQANTSEHTITYTGNKAHDFSSQIGNGVHGDGFFHYFGVPSSDSTQYMDGMTFCNNTAYGDFRNTFDGGPANTALFFTEGGYAGTECNNDFSFTPVVANTWRNLIVHSANGNTHSTIGVSIYNNSLVNAGTNAMSGAIDIVGGQTNVTLKNNIASGMSYAVVIEDTASQVGFVSDYNLWNPTVGFQVNAVDQNSAQWKALGYDAHSVFGSDPSWVSAPGNEHLNSGSPARNAGTNLTSLGITILDSDHDGVGRPGGATAWDVGAHQFAGAPSPPSILTVIVN
jgi:hypothetical protein